jgi:hypothetical protein
MTRHGHIWKTKLPMKGCEVCALEVENARLRDALERIRYVQLDPRLGRTIGPEHYEKALSDCGYIAKEALKPFRESEK